CAYAAVLEGLDHDIVTATSGNDAVRLLAERQFALLLIAVRTQGIDGFETVDPHVLRGKVRNLLALYEQGIELERRAALLMEQQKQLAEAAAEARRQDTNIGIVAHDLRNPLNAITTGADLIRRVLDLPDQAHAIADRIDRSARRMTLMIRDILDFSRGHL